MLVTLIVRLSVFYLPDYVQTTLLVGTATALLAVEAVSSTMGAPAAYRDQMSQMTKLLYCNLDLFLNSFSDFAYLFESDSKRETVRRVLTAIVTLAPVRFVLHLPFCYLWYLIDAKFDHVGIKCLKYRINSCSSAC